MTQFTVDVSHHDNDRIASGLINWPKVRGANIIASCAKLTEGDPSRYSFTDPRGPANARGARDAGLLSGGYHCLSACDETGAARQVDFFRRALHESLGDEWWAMLDVEPFPELKDRGVAPLWADVRRFAAHWDVVEPGRPLLVYLPRWYWSSSTFGSPNMRVIANPLVASDYGANKAGAVSDLYAAAGRDSGRGWLAYGNKTPALLQFTSRGQVPGASDATDVNAYRDVAVPLSQLLYGEEDDVPLTDAQDTALSIAWEVADALRDGQDITEARKNPVWLVKQVKTLAAQSAANGVGLSEVKTALDELAARLDALSAAPPVSVSVTPAQLKEALRELLLDGVADLPTSEQ